MVAVVAHGNVSGLSGGTTSGLNTLGASLLLAALGYAGTAAGNVSDSLGNTWTPLTQYVPSPNDRSEQMLYVANPTVGSSQTFSTANTVATLCVLAASGIATVSPFDVENGGSSSSFTHQDTGGITPSTDGQLIVTGSQNGGVNSQSVNSPFIEVENVNLIPATAFGCALAYYVQPTAGVIAAVWTFTGNTTSACSIASFKAGAAPSGNPWHYYAQMRRQGA